MPTSKAWYVNVHVSEHILHTIRFEVPYEQLKEAYNIEKSHLKISRI